MQAKGEGPDGPEEPPRPEARSTNATKHWGSGLRRIRWLTEAGGTQVARGEGWSAVSTCLFGGRLRGPDHNRRPRRVLPRRRSQPPHGGALQGLGSIAGSSGRKSQAVGRVPGPTLPEGAREAVLRTSRPTSSTRPNVDSVSLRRRWPDGSGHRDTGGITCRARCRTRSLAQFSKVITLGAPRSSLLKALRSSPERT